MKFTNTIFDFITEQESAYALPITIEDGYEWNMKSHIRLSNLYKNSQFSTGNSESDRDQKPFKNIIRPILNLQYRAEGFDVKDIVLFLNSKSEYYKSFLIKKFHDKWARENSIDTFIDEMVESYVDYGGALVKNVNQVRPEVVPLQSLVFCDQTDILSGPIGIKHFYSPDQLKEMEEIGWGNEANGANITLDELIILANDTKVVDKTTGRDVKTPGKYIEVYEVHGVFPENFVKENGEPDKYSRQLHIVSFYQDENGRKQGLTLFKGKEKELPFKLILRDKIYGRALGFGGAEELFEPQVWVNYDQIRMKGMLDQAAKVLYKTTDQAFANRNKTTDLDNGEIMVLEEGKDIGQIDTTPRNITLFQNSVVEWENHARQMGAATESIMGESPTSGTPFKLQELVTAESHSLHEYRKGKLATFLSEIYRDWIIPYIAREVVKNQEFISTLDLDELLEIVDKVMVKKANESIKEQILTGNNPDPLEIDSLKQQAKDQFMKGNKKFLEIAKDEFRSILIDVEVNIAGKQKNLSAMTDKLVNVFRQIISAPQTLDDPRMAKIFNQILEYSGMSPIDFSSKPNPPQQQLEQQIPQTQPQLTI